MGFSPDIKGRLRLTTGDIITLKGVDEVVNVANASLLGGGISGAIHRAAGPELWPNAEDKGRPPEEARLSGMYRSLRCHPHPWPDLAGVGPPKTNKF